MTPKPKGTWRIGVLNPNGVSVGNAGSLPILLEGVKGMQADAFFLSETKLATDQPWVQEQVSKCCGRTYGRKHKVITASSDIPFHTQYKPGGVMGVVNGDSVGRVLSMGACELGRWAWMRMNGGGGRVITLIVTYQVCQASVRQAGPTTAIVQQFSMLSQRGKHQPHQVRHHHAHDLVNFVKDCQNNGDKVIVVGDFNETIGGTGGGMTRLCSDCGLKDPVFEMHGHTGFNTHLTGTTCIDCVLLDPDLLPSVQACGYEPFGARVSSDHRGMFLDVNEAMFFGNATAPLPKPSPRSYASKNIKQTKDYFQHMENHLTNHNWHDNIKHLQQ